MKKLSGESGVKRAVEQLCEVEHIPCFRMQAGNIVIPGRGRIKLNPAGTADLLLAPNCPRGIMQIPEPVFLWVELKHPNGGKITEAQLAFADQVRKRGMAHIFVNDVRQVIDWLKENRAR